MQVSHLTTLLSGALLAAGASIAAAQTSSGPGTPGAVASDAANKQCWDKASNKLRNNVNLSGTTTTGSTSGSTSGTNSGTSSASGVTSPSGVSAPSNAPA